MERESSAPEERRDTLDRAMTAGLRTWPWLVLNRETLRAYLDERLPGRETSVSEAILADLYLACACLAQEAGAIPTFTRLHLAQVPALTRAYDRSPAFADEVAQGVQTKLFVREEGGAPKIAQYRGQGPLNAWVKVSVVRAAQRLAGDRHRTARSLDDGLAEAIGYSNNVELQLLRTELREAFTRAFEQAVRELPRKLRLTLRLNVVKRVSTTAIARLNNVDQSTVCRWIGEARERLATATRRTLRESLKLSRSEIESLLTVLDSQVDLHLSQLLATNGTSINDAGS